MPRRLQLVVALLTLAVLAAPTAASAVSARGHDDDRRVADGPGAAVVVISGDVDVARGEAVEAVYVISGDVRIAGQVDGDVVVLDGDVLVSGRIEGNLFTAAGTAHLLPSAEVTGDVGYGDEHPVVSLDARVHGDVSEQGWPDAGELFAWVGGLVIWLAITLSMLVFGVLLILIAPRAADALYMRSRERVGPTIAIGIAVAIALPVLALIAAITIFGIPLALGIGLALAPLGATAYAASSYALGRRIVKQPGGRMLAYLAGLAVLRILAAVPLLGALVGLAALILGLGLIGAAIGAAREPDAPTPAHTPGS